MSSHVFQRVLTCNTWQQHKHKQQWREERDARFHSWKYSHYFEFVLAKDENIKVHCPLYALTSAGGPPPPKQQKLDFGAKHASGGELKKLVGRYVVVEMLPLNTVD